MKNIFFILCFLCQIAFGREIIVVSIPMQQEFAQKIAGEQYEVVSLVKSGVNPHDFEPKFSDVKKVNSAVAYFGIGIEFEDIWLPRFKAQNKAMQVFDNSLGITRIFWEHSHSKHESHDSMQSHHSHERGDTHIWLSPNNAKQIAKNIYESLKTLDSSADYTKAYEALIAEIQQTHLQLEQILSTLPQHQQFVVFHPMLGYFARDYHLEEIAIEIEGKSPKMQEMVRVIETIKKNKLKIIFAQPEFSTKAAEFIAKESGAKLGFFSPLKTPWSENLLEFANTLSNKNLEP
ncbi:zinc ABC transporter substrate-binding protein [Helicobacter sp. MIT 05-5294]|uniref:metal ABC transporter solute-binding protein, Zn/Mn family n=1 Tax=Helicobacter sp. MIT 05-5294 TaxID=1548150 RepID=UPI00051F998C|nr:zinc ABC transporter substrate-binding protein [Helicobacter sp. MIT 05-5294]TLD86543.1 ABC transporter [Helicobacter sp. MIT 05-5294]